MDLSWGTEMVEIIDGEKVASYTRMDKGTVEDYAYLGELAKPFRDGTADRVLANLERLHESYPGGRIDRYRHSVQTATRAYRAGECEEYVVAALLHDIGDMLAPENHGPFAAEIIRPYVSRNVYWMVWYHQVFQGYYFWDKVGKDPNDRDKYKDHPAYDMTVRLCGEYDQMSFDPDYENLPISFFEPMVRRLFARESWAAHHESEWPVDGSPANAVEAAAE
jgi:predicted HD phosphohydrolase